MRTGPLGDGSPITEPDTQLTLQFLDNITSTLNLTKEEEEAYKALSLDGKCLITVLEAIRGKDDHDQLFTDQSITNSNTTPHLHKEDNKQEKDVSNENNASQDSLIKDKSVSLGRKSTSNDDYKPEDNMFDIMIRNNENLITALIGKADGDENTNLLKTVDEGITNNGETIGDHIEGIKD